MSNLVIVAIPDENDRVMKVSSEKVPHLTLLFLGDVNDVANVGKITEFVEHAANTTLRRFYLPVDRRGELGDDPEKGPADVLFFKKSRYDYKAIRDFRAALLRDSNIKTAHDSVDQYEEWTPHLTLGYKTTPAKKDESPFDQGFYDVAFDRIAIWSGDYEGPEFVLKDYWDEYDCMVDGELAMSDIRRINDPSTLRHFSPLDANWGIRKEEGSDRARKASKGLIAFGDDRTAEFMEHHGVKQKDPKEQLTEDNTNESQTADLGSEFLAHFLGENEEVTTSDLGAEFLAHHGIKGQKWGVRKERSAPSPVTPKATSVVPHGEKKKTKIKAEGGENHDAHPDAIKVAEARAKLKKSGPAALSNKELREVRERAQLEQQVTQITSSGGKKFIANLLRQQGQQAANQAVQKKVKQHVLN